MSLAVLALALGGWAALVLLAAWSIRFLVAKLTEASDIKTTKVPNEPETIIDTYTVDDCATYGS